MMMAQVTEDFARQMLVHAARGEHAPLTRWEEEQLARAWLCLNDARKLAAQQAEDDGLWFDAAYVTENYLQRALRTLAAVIEGSNAKLTGLAPEKGD
jgi:hypothetical protein